MEKLALSVWLALLFGTGVANHQPTSVFEGFPALPVPAGNTLTEAQEEPRKGLVYDRRASSAPPSCSNCRASVSRRFEPTGSSVSQGTTARRRAWRSRTTPI